MVTQWGFASDSLSPTAWESPNGSGFGQPQMASEETQKRIDAEVEVIVRKAYKVCKDTLETNRSLLDKITDSLMENETIDAQQLVELVGAHADPKYLEGLDLKVPEPLEAAP